MIETKVAAGSFTGILTGLLTWALVAYVPAFRAGLPPPVAALIPVAAAWLAHSIAAYMAPHTPRPVTPIPGIRPPGAPSGAVKINPPISAPELIVPPSTGPLPDPPAPGVGA